eukprot:TRINITY_DN38935_c0_g1_i1.p1 TRINITY_DN38935_c0_g1~~TRINITY_DN38935_c0_g1_i1.p1  ORF type:complete len:169 (+),score=1.56 TRINITY_DN38935_c0_g1_i1:39-545(+)
MFHVAFICYRTIFLNHYPDTQFPRVNKLIITMGVMTQILTPTMGRDASAEISRATGLEVRQARQSKESILEHVLTPIMGRDNSLATAAATSSESSADSISRGLLSNQRAYGGKIHPLLYKVHAYTHHRPGGGRFWNHGEMLPWRDLNWRKGSLNGSADSKWNHKHHSK